MEQVIIHANQDYSALDDFFARNGIRRVFLVHTKSFGSLRISGYFAGLEERLGVETVAFSGFHPNPDYGSVVEGERLFRGSGCDCIVAVGGGSAIDVAKCIKLYMGLDPGRPFMEQTPIPNGIRLVAVPTTAGTGSEATRYAVIYYNGEKQSVTSEDCVPSEVILDPSLLHTLPDYQRKSTMLDALCHSIEAYWSVNSTDESKAYSEKALRMILGGMDLYLGNDERGNRDMLVAANLAGRAINITQTTAGHAMCYKLTSMYGIAHGHAAALCVSALWPYMVSHTDLCADSRGKAYLDKTLSDLAEIMGCSSAMGASERFDAILERLGLGRPEADSSADFDVLKASVNPVRMKNNPVRLTGDAIDFLYRQILEG